MMDQKREKIVDGYLLVLTNGKKPMAELKEKAVEAMIRSWIRVYDWKLYAVKLVRNAGKNDYEVAPNREPVEVSHQFPRFYSELETSDLYLQAIFDNIDFSLEYFNQLILPEPRPLNDQPKSELIWLYR